MVKERQTFIASASELQSSKLFMTLKMIMFTANEANLNKVRCSEAFIDEIVENQDKYIALPLCADIRNLVQGNYKKLGHMYNPLTGEFLSTDIGGFVKFEKEEIAQDKKALVGYARVSKRKKAVCAALAELFAEGDLKFSFEIACGSAQKLDDGTQLIDRADDNYLEGLCVVSLPACPDAVAMQLVAEIVDEGPKEAEEVPKETEAIVAEAEEPVAEIAETEPVEAQTETAATVTEEIASSNEDTPDIGTEEKEEDKEESKEELAEESASEETAEVVVTEIHRESDEVHAYDTETDEEVHRIVTTEEVVRSLADDESETETPKEEVAEETAEVSKASEPAESVARIPELEAFIAEMRQANEALKSELSELRKEIAELTERAPEQIVAEVIRDQVNPMLGSIETPVKYTLLEKEEKPTAYTLV